MLNFQEPRNRNFFALFALLIFAAFSIATIAVLFTEAGWPRNHEYNSFIIRTLVYAQHYNFYDFLPIYSSLDNNNFGSPFPAFYHKLFYVFSAIIFLLISNLKIALAITISLFLTIGAFGIFLTLRQLKLSKFAAISGGIFLIVANYTVTNWLVRGAMAELAAMMIIPWVIFYFLRMIRDQKINYGLAVSLALVFFAHSVIFFYLLLLLGLGFFLGVKPNSWKSFFNKSSIAPFILCLLLCLPNLLLIKIFSNEYKIDLIVPNFFQPQSQMNPFYKYFFPSDWNFGDSYDGMLIRIDGPLILAIIIAITMLVWRYQKGFKLNSKKIETLKSLLPLITILVFCLLLQMPIAEIFYNHFPGAKFIQFPWRLLAMITPIIIILSLCLLDAAFEEQFSKIAILFCLVAMILFCGAFRKMHYDYFPIANSLSDFSKMSLNAYGEYIPKKLANQGLPSLEKIMKNNLANGCKTTSNQILSEVKNVRFNFDCKNQAAVTLPIFISKMHKITLLCEEKNCGEISCEASKYLDGLCDINLPKGQSELEVSMPNLFR